MAKLTKKIKQQKIASQGERPAAEVAVPLPTLPVIASKSQGDEAKGQDKVGMGTSVLSLQCPYCQSEDFVKRGTRMKKGGKTQLYLCRACKRTFTPVWFKGLNIAPPYYLTDANNYIGKIYTGAGSGLRGFVRGSGGIYGLDLSHTPSEQNASIGFRCAK